MGIDGLAFREEIFARLRAMLHDTNGTLHRSQLESFSINGQRLPLISGQNAIHNPRDPIALDATLSVYSRPGSKYPDGSSEDGIWDYHYEGDTPGGRNLKLRAAHTLKLPIIFYDWIAPSIYAPLFPVHVVEDDPTRLRVKLAFDPSPLGGIDEPVSAVEESFRKATIAQRVHQTEFRARVLHAYSDMCAICGMPFASLLDAAHIRPYGTPGSTAHAVSNGLALCTIHHRAYDRKLLGIDGERRLYVHPLIESTQDGPVFAASLQQLPSALSFVPRGKDAPDPDRLEVTFKEFVDALPS